MRSPAPRRPSGRRTELSRGRTRCLLPDPDSGVDPDPDLDYIDYKIVGQFPSSRPTAPPPPSRIVQKSGVRGDPYPSVCNYYYPTPPLYPRCSAHLGRLTGFACKSFSIVNPRGRQLKALCRQLRVVLQLMSKGPPLLRTFVQFWRGGPPPELYKSPEEGSPLTPDFCTFLEGGVPVGQELENCQSFCSKSMLPSTWHTLCFIPM